MNGIFQTTSYALLAGLPGPVLGRVRSFRVELFPMPAGKITARCNWGEFNVLPGETYYFGGEELLLQSLTDTVSETVDVTLMTGAILPASGGNAATIPNPLPVSVINRPQVVPVITNGAATVPWTGDTLLTGAGYVGGETWNIGPVHANNTNDQNVATALQVLLITVTASPTAVTTVTDHEGNALPLYAPGASAPIFSMPAGQAVGSYFYVPIVACLYWNIVSTDLTVGTYNVVGGTLPWTPPLVPVGSGGGGFFAGQTMNSAYNAVASGQAAVTLVTGVAGKTIYLVGYENYNDQTLNTSGSLFQSGGATTLGMMLDDASVHANGGSEPYLFACAAGAALTVNSTSSTQTGYLTFRYYQF